MTAFIHRIIKIILMMRDVAVLLLNYSCAEKLAKQSLLGKRLKREEVICPLCKEGKPQMLIEFPLSWPMPQNDHLLYYDYSAPYFAEVLEKKDLLFKTAGFFLSTCWNFCPNCRNAILSTKFSDRHLSEYYSKYYKRLAKPSLKRRAAKEPYAKYVDSLVKSGIRLLEFGAAEGYAANYLAMRGHNVTVVEPSSFRNIVMQNKGISVCDNALLLPKGHFDCIYLHHVLEHFNDPAAFITLAETLLKEGGLLIIQVPDISLQMRLYLSSLHMCHYALVNPIKKNDELLTKFFSDAMSKPYYWMDALGNNHLYAFTSFGLEYLLKKNNFKIKKVKQTTKDNLKFDKRFLAWPVDAENGQTPNGLTIVAQK